MALGVLVNACAPTTPVKLTPDEITLGTSLRDCPECPEMVVVPAGSFEMGDLSGSGDSDERPIHKVTILRPFAVGRYEVTFDQWDACVGESGCERRWRDNRWGRGSRPVLYVSWKDAKEYVAWLSRSKSQRDHGPGHTALVGGNASPSPKPPTPRGSTPAREESNFLSIETTTAFA